MVLHTLHKSRVSHARVGSLLTKDGCIETPAFVAVATNAALKAVDLRSVPDLDVLFCNTYHLMLHPGADVVAETGGLRRFMNTDRVIMTDSGGFQVFSLKHGTVHDELVHSSSLKKASVANKSKRQPSVADVRVSEGGVGFRSYRDGTRLLLTPELSVQAQKQLNGSIIMPLDELPPYHVSYEDLKASLDRTLRWEQRSLDEHLKQENGQLMYYIIHGGSDRGLRKRSVDFVRSKGGWGGYAIGGALGKDREEMRDIVEHVMGECGLRQLRENTGKPVHVLGVADPKSIKQLVKLGCDTFDSCWATKVARHGAMLCEPSTTVPSGRINIQSGRWKRAHFSLPGCSCHTCSTYSLSYLHHLAKAKEPVFQSLISIHNLTFMTNFMKDIRRQIEENVL
jgi:queuine tRNA-ribosyltransferase